MSSYAFCKECGESLDAPTMRDVVYGWRCIVGHANEIDEDLRHHILLDLEDRIQRLEERVSSLYEE